MIELCDGNACSEIEHRFECRPNRNKREFALEIVRFKKTLSDRRQYYVTYGQNKSVEGQLASESSSGRKDNVGWLCFFAFKTAVYLFLFFFPAKFGSCALYGLITSAT